MVFPLKINIEANIKSHVLTILKDIDIPLSSVITKGRRQNFLLQILKNVKSKLYYTENSNTRVQTV